LFHRGLLSRHQHQVCRWGLKINDRLSLTKKSTLADA
jgi:hypothetical protein